MNNISLAMTFLSYFSNYELRNTNNIFNSLIAIYKLLTEDQREAFFEILVIEMGKSFMKEFRLYVFNKMPSSQMLAYFNNYD